MSGLATSELYAVVDLSKKKTKKPAINRDGDSSDRDVVMYDVLNRIDMEHNEARKDNKPQLLREKSNFSHTSTTNILIIFIVILTWVVLAITFIMIIILYLKPSTTNIANSDVLMNNQKENNTAIKISVVQKDDFTEIIKDIYSNYSAEFSTVKLATKYLQNMSSILEDRNEILNFAISNIYNIIDNITYNLSLLETTSINNYKSSCSGILSENPSYPSGNYILRSSTNELRSVYCDMTSQFGSNSSGWMRIAKLDVQHCPQGLEEHDYMSNTIQACRVAKSEPGCTQLAFSAFSVPYTKIAGKVRGYDVGTLDGFRMLSNNGGIDINSNYVDGISITSSNQHVWTFAASCACSETSMAEPIGNNYICNRPTGCMGNQICGSLLWSSQKCGETSLPWFFRTIQSTTAEIDVRICRDQERNDEDVAISTLELYVQ